MAFLFLSQDQRQRCSRLVFILSIHLAAQQCWELSGREGERKGGSPVFVEEQKELEGHNQLPPWDCWVVSSALPNEEDVGFFT